MKRIIWLGAVLLSLGAMAAPQWIVNRQAKLPLTAVMLTFQVGSADDPTGSEGLASLTASLMQDGGVKAWKGMPALDRAGIQDRFQLAGASVYFTVEKQQTSLRLLAPASEIEGVAKLAVQMLVAPAFDNGQLKRLLNEAEEALAKQWPREDQEELGKAFLDYALFGPNHPYSHVEDGKISGLKKINAEGVRRFYEQHFTPDRLTVGLAGVVSPRLQSWMAGALTGLPKGKSRPATIPAPPAAQGVELWIVKGDFQGTGVHFGTPLSVTRAHPDFAALYLASTAFGKHRSFVGRLMRVVREERGLNYGAYSYVEDFPDGGRSLIPPTQAARSIQAFTLWGRPTPPENGCFLARQLWREANRLATEGLSEQEFSLAQSHLVGSLPELALSLDRQLGYATDSRFYGVKGDYLKSLSQQVSQLDRKTVNAAIAKYLRPSNFRMVMTAADPESLKESLLGKKCGITYGEGITKSKEVTDEDKLISETKIPLTPEQIHVMDAGAIF